MKLSNYSKVFKALSNEQRLKIFLMLYEQYTKGSRDGASFEIKEACCPVEKAFTKICGCVKLSRSTISHHFKELQNAGLIICERQGQVFKCRVNEETIKSIKEFLG